METSKDEPLDDVAATLNHLIRLMRDRGLHDTAQFLAMAKTQFLIERNGISDSEFRALCDWVEASKRLSGATRRLRVPGATAVCARCAAPGNARRTRPRVAAADARRAQLRKRSRHLPGSHLR